MLDDDVMEAIDQLVGQRGRSRFLEEAAREKLERLNLEKALASTAGILKEKEYPEFKDQASINVWVRAQRGPWKRPDGLRSRFDRPHRLPA